MNGTHISQNLRRLRLDKEMTQEQLAAVLGVSCQSVSRWECGNTLPDVMLLPELARIYGVTVDDLFREKATAYPSYAQRLLAVYEASGRTEDFLAAEMEFCRISEESLTADDLRAWGALYHYMLKRSAQKARQKLQAAMEHPHRTDAVFSSAAQQKVLLMCDLGRGDEAISQYERKRREAPDDAQNWLLCTAANHMAGNHKRAMEVAREGISRFPDNAALYVYAGDICGALKQYDKAVDYWEKAYEMNPSMLDPVYAMGLCYEELGQYEKAYVVWVNLMKDLDKRGMIIERKFPEERAAHCLERIV